ncbi:hypothetical protein B0T20DRAFT_245276 [Sordaria brevicollis]|uniref:Uncharacterized protein n=1 Tax=Sordaria brevicollis TaxID=83679 RepID=A0AAE0PBM2_SORBR|nr:hypothetical protein B0T20DRAFT_245276 [Sordaria brevicollis]
MPYSNLALSRPVLRVFFLALVSILPTANALVIRDHPFDDGKATVSILPIESGRFSEHCRKPEFNSTTCILSTSCTTAADNSDRTNIFGMDGRRQNYLNINTCFWYHHAFHGMVEEDSEGLGWMVDWNVQNGDRQGITNICEFCDVRVDNIFEDEKELEREGWKKGHPFMLMADCSPPRKEGDRFVKGDPGFNYKNRNNHLPLDRYISNNNGFLECFGRRQT